MTLADLQALQTQAEQDYAAAVLTGQIPSSGQDAGAPQVVYVTETEIVTSFVTRDVDRNTQAATEYVTITHTVTGSDW